MAKYSTETAECFIDPPITPIKTRAKFVIVQGVSVRGRLILFQGNEPARGAIGRWGITVRWHADVFRDLSAVFKRNDQVLITLGTRRGYGYLRSFEVGGDAVSACFVGASPLFKRVTRARA